MAYRLPFGFNKADGITVIPNNPIGTGGSGTVGTSDPSGDLQKYENDTGFDANGNPTAIEQPSDLLPEVERAEQATASNQVKMSWAAALSFIGVIARGTFLIDSYNNIWRVLSSKIKGERGGMAIFSTVSESISFDTPPDDYQMIPVELGIDIIKHPRYAWALLPYVTDQSTYTLIGDTKVFYVDIKESIVRLIQSYRDSPFYPNADYINGLIQNNIMSQLKINPVTGISYLSVTVPNPNFVQPNNNANALPPVSWDGTNTSLATISTGVQNLVLSVPVNTANANDPVTIALAAAREIISKLWRQEDTPYVVGFQITWTQYFFQPVYENPGGYVENPIGIVPDYFVSPTTPGAFYTVLPRGTLASGYGTGNLNPNNLDTVSGGGSPTIFDQIIAINPQAYSSNGTSSGNLDISWLRKADEVEYQRTWFKVTRTWIGSPIGHWDSDLYHNFGVSGPQDANDFNVLPINFH